MPWNIRRGRYGAEALTEVFDALGERGALRTTPKQRGGVTRKGFLPGRSGNAGGRPKRVAKLIETIQQHTHDGEDLVDFMLKTFRSGPMRYRMEAAHWLTERGFRRAPQVVEHVGEEGGPIHVKVTWVEQA